MTMSAYDDHKRYTTWYCASRLETTRRFPRIYSTFCNEVEVFPEVFGALRLGLKLAEHVNRSFLTRHFGPV